MKKAAIILFSIFSLQAQAQSKLNVALAGLSHDHVNLIMNDYQQDKVNIIGIAEANPWMVNYPYQLPQ